MNLDLAESELYFEKTNLPTGYKPWIFYSWQSDYNPSRSRISNSIRKIIEEMNTRSPKYPVELVAPRTAKDGADDIVQIIRRNIDRCLMAVFDITNVAEVITDFDRKKKAYPNANVVFELGYALQRKNPDQIILLKRSRDDLHNDDVPFDFSHNTRVNYKSESELYEQLSSIVFDYIIDINFIDNSSSP